MRRWCMQALAAAWLLCLCGCVSVKHSPPARFFVLRALAASPTPTKSAATDAQVVGVMPAELPDHLARSQMVIWTSDNEVRLQEFTRWAEPLDVGTTRVVRENLVSLLPQHRFVEFPWKTTEPVRCRVQVEVRRFGLQPDGTVRLDGRWALLPPGDELPFEMQTVALHSKPVGKGDPEAMVGAMSQLLSDLCAQVAAGIRRLPLAGSQGGRGSQP